MPDRNQEPKNIPAAEEKVLAFWTREKIFEKSLARQGEKGDFVFYDGPPFATGLPHYGHILQSVMKDVVPRYKTMRGYRVPRRWGWDCHGLPLENIIEGELGIKTKKEIEALGLTKFNRAAREAVLRFAEEWRRIIPRIGRWVDMENDYKTMDAAYTESVWWSFKTLYDKGLIYEGYKSMHLCPRCGTTLSNFEVNQGYKDVKDVAVYVKFELADEPHTYLLAWTTTPWTLPGNAALAVNGAITYGKFAVGNGEAEGKEFFILAKERAAVVLKNLAYRLIEEIPARDLMGRSYKPLFDYYARDESLENRENGWKVYAADFVTTEEGAGVVHVAPAFGEDDMALGQREKLPFIQHVALDGTFEPEVRDFAGAAVKPKGEDRVRLAADLAVAEYLDRKNLLFAKESVTHSYPYCWRCETPLLNYAASSWFVRVTDERLHRRMIEENQKIHWVPTHVRDGRFGKWLEGARDWAISRSRYWGAPIPVWKCPDCGEVFVAGSLEDLKKRLHAAANRYLVMRHGEAENNVLKVLSAAAEKPHRLTAKGRGQVMAAAARLKLEKIDLIVSSPFVRGRETAEILRRALDLPPEAVRFDPRLGEVNFGELDGHSTKEYSIFFDSLEERFVKAPPRGENMTDIKRRMGEALYALEETTRGKNILLITHSTPAWALFAAAGGLSRKAAVELFTERDDVFLMNAEARALDFLPLPHNEDYELDLHRPYIDAVASSCSCGEGRMMTRVKEVFDCWYESGSMPYASNGYLGVAQEKFDPGREVGYPAEYIGEAIDQTRGWFYTMHVLGVALFDRASFRNVTSTGFTLAEDGQKMSKRLKNYPDPVAVINRYGADALRYYILNSPVVRGGDLNFSERDVKEVMNKVVDRLKNVVIFYEQNALRNEFEDLNPWNSYGESKNILDQWINAAMGRVIYEVTTAMESYEMDEAARPIESFVDDLSTWYIRRSRDRLRHKDTEALQTIHAILRVFSRLVAPFMPFVAEEVWQKVKSKNDAESVHLAKWPELSKEEKLRFMGGEDIAISAAMKETRRIVSLGLEAREKAGIKVRQPLSKIKIKGVGAFLPEEYLVLVKDELNVKNVELEGGDRFEVELDTIITEELKREGMLRDLVRAVQDLRKKAGLRPGEPAVLAVATDAAGEAFVKSFEHELKQATAVSEIKFEEVKGGEEFKIGDLVFTLKIAV